MGNELALAYKAPTVGDSWRSFKSHLGTFALLYLTSVVLFLIAYVISLVCNLVIPAIGDYSEGSIYFATILGWILSSPFSILNNLFGVLLIAIVPIYYSTGEVVSFKQLLNILKSRFWRYILAGAFWSIAVLLGYLFCIVPGIILALITPVYVQKIFTTNLTVLESFKNSWSSVFNSGKAGGFFGVSILVGLVTGICTILTCGIGGLIFVPMAYFYVFNYASHVGVIKYSNN